MLAKKITEILEQQISKELASSYAYLGMSSYCQSIGFEGAAKWLKLQSAEEREHAYKIYDYLELQQVKPKLPAISAPRQEFASLIEVFEQAVAHERSVTNSINEIASTAQADRDHATYSLMQWFVNEQLEEEASALKIVEQLKMIGDNPGLLLSFDRVLANRAK